VLTQSIPKVALAPILVVALGANELPRVVVTFLVAFFPLVVSVAAGLLAVPEDLIELGRSYRASKLQQLYRIRLPYAVPFIFSGLKVAITLSVVGAVVGEFVAADQGLGYLITSSTAFFKTPVAFGAMILLSLMGIVLFQLVAIIERVFFPRLAVAPTIPLHCSDDFMLACGRMAAEHEVGLHMHLAESKVQALIGMERYGETLTAHLSRIGLLGQNFTAAHAVWLDDDDARRIADHGGSVAHNPSSNMRFGSGLADVRAMLEAGVNVGLGTDGSSCGDNQNMFEAMRLASFVSRVHGPRIERWLTTREAVEAATVGSAKALGFGDRLGRLAPGFQADLVLLDLGHVNWLPFNDPTNQLVHLEDGNAVHSVMIGGRMVVENRRPTMVDAADLARRAEAAPARLAEETRPMRELYERLEPVVGTFCSALASRPYHVRRFAAHDHPHDHRRE
jgi:Amidohydrolase family/Binding-protein-dependent transport system inner membrane component